MRLPNRRTAKQVHMLYHLPVNILRTHGGGNEQNQRQCVHKELPYFLSPARHGCLKVNTTDVRM